MKFHVAIVMQFNIGETGRRKKAKKRKNFDAVKRMNVKKAALCQHIVEFDHFIGWVEAKI